MTIAVTVEDGGDTITAGIVEFVDKAAAVAAATAAATEAAEAYADGLFESIPPGATLAPARAASTTNYAGAYPFTGLPSSSDTDGVTLADGDVLLLTGQTASSRNGPWIVHTGAWSRPSDFTTGSTIPDGKTIEVLTGTTEALTTWEVTGTGTIDTNVQTWTQLHSSLLTRTDGDGRYLPTGSSDMYAPPLGVLLGGDDFHRSDRSIIGDASPYGHIYITQGIVNAQTITGNAYTSATSPGAADIVYNEFNGLQAMKVKVRFTDDGSTVGQNAVIGCCAAGSGFGSGSIQMYASLTDCAVFVVENPIVDPYPNLIHVTFPQRLSAGIEYEFVVRRDKAASAVTFDYPGGSMTAADPMVNTYWGDKVGIQQRRPASTDGHVSITGWQAFGKPPSPAAQGQTVAATIARLHGGYAAVVPPAGLDLSTHDLDVIAWIEPDSWASGSVQSIVTHWPIAGDNSFDFRLGTDGTLRLICSQDGTSITGLSAISTATAGGTDGVGMWVRVKRTIADGTVTFYTSTSAMTTAVGSIVWSALGATRPTTAGGLHKASGPINVGIRSENDNKLTGQIAVVSILNGVLGAELAGLDLRGDWTPTDAEGNEWSLYGKVRWKVTEAAVDGLLASIASLQSQIDSLSVPSVFAVAVKTAATTRTTATLTNSTDLVLPLAASTTYLFEALLITDGATADDVKIAFTVPSGATITWTGTGLILAGASQTSTSMNISTVTASGTSASYGTLGIGTPTTIRVRGVIVTSAAAGSLTLQTAQNVADAANPTSIYAGSYLVTQKVS